VGEVGKCAHLVKIKFEMAFYGVNQDVMVRELNLKFKLFV
jgi:hypothetical protein